MLNDAKGFKHIYICTGFELSGKEHYEAGIEQGRSEGIEQGRSEGIEQGRSEGIELGRSEGIELGRRQTLIQLVLDEELTLELAAKQLNITKEEFEKLLCSPSA